MKKIYFLLFMILMGGAANAQDPEPQIDGKKMQDIEALKVAFISKELELTPEEAQKFWPLYNQYSKELRELRRSSKDDDDVLARDEKVLNLRKKYKDQFAKILGVPRMNRLFESEGKFHQLLIKAMRKRQGMQNNPNRPFMRKGG